MEEALKRLKRFPGTTVMDIQAHSLEVIALTLVDMNEKLGKMVEKLDRQG